MRANRRKDVAPVESGIHLGQPIFGLVQVNDANFQARRFGILKHGGDQTVIRHHVVLVAQLRGDCPPFCAYARIDHSHMDRTGREVGRCAPERDRSRSDILGWDFMADVCDVDVRSNPPDDAFHRADKAI